MLETYRIDDATDDVVGGILVLVVLVSVRVGHLRVGWLVGWYPEIIDIFQSFKCFYGCKAFFAENQFVYFTKQVLFNRRVFIEWFK